MESLNRVSLSREGHFVQVNNGCRPFVAPWWRVLVGSALQSGACAWRLRQSARAFSGAVVVVGFGLESSAREFAASWAAWCGVPLALRRGSGGGGVPWAVSVPVSPPASLRARPGARLPSSAGRVWVGSKEGVL